MPWLSGLQNLDPAFFHGVAVVLGLLIGSFLNVVILRLPKIMEQEWRQQCAELAAAPEPACGAQTTALAATQPRDGERPLSLSHPASTCPHCGHGIRAWENVPVLSYLLLRGRCAACRQAISPRYPLVELATGLLSLGVTLHFGVTWTALAALLCTWALIALAMIDLDTQLLPDAITLPLLWGGLIVNTQHLFVPLVDAVWGAVAGYLALWLVHHLFRLLTGKEGMGYGDFKLLAALGAWLGWQMLPVVILLSSLVGALVGIGLIVLRGHQRSNPIPFGPWLACAGWIAMLWGEALVRNYLALFAVPPLPGG